MIKSNLKIILAGSNIRITRVFNDTGISRTTLTALSEGHSKGIQFDTINILCRYLKIEPKDLFIYAPIDITPRVAELRLLETHNGEGFEGVLYLNIDDEGHVSSDEYEFECSYVMPNKTIQIDLFPTSWESVYTKALEKLPRELQVYSDELIKKEISLSLWELSKYHENSFLCDADYDTDSKNIVLNFKDPRF